MIRYIKIYGMSLSNVKVFQKTLNYVILFTQPQAK